MVQVRNFRRRRRGGRVNGQSGMPAAARSFGVRCACDVNRGSETSESTPPRLGACRMMRSFLRKRSAAAPPASSIAIMPLNPLIVDAATAFPVPGVDGLITADPRVCLGVYVADCCAVYLVEPERRVMIWSRWKSPRRCRR